MSVSAAQSTLRSIEGEIGRQEKRKSNATAKATKLETQITDKQNEIFRTTNASLIRSKQQQIDGWIKERNRMSKEASDAGAKLTTLYEKKRKAEAALRDEQQKENDKENKRLLNRINELTTEMQSNAPIREPNMIMQCVRPVVVAFPEALALFDSAAEKYETGGIDRNALDDMRLCLEKIMQELFANEKSLENQIEVIGKLLKGSGLSDEYRNTLTKIIDYYCKYQNNHVKHDDSINQYEVSFIVEMTCILIKQMIEQFGQDLDEETDLLIEKSIQEVE